MAPGCDAGCCAGFDRLFDDRRARQDLKEYRRDGPRKTTRWLLDALQDAGVRGASLMDIGGGVGVLQHELVRAGASSVTAVDASEGFLRVAREEAARQGYGDRASYVLGDYAKIAPTLPRADLVTMDRVVCCYADMPGLVGGAADRADRLLGLVYPRDTWLPRLAQAWENGVNRLLRNPFRGFVHPPGAVDEILRSRGLRIRSHRQDLAWRVDVYERARAR